MHTKDEDRLTEEYIILVFKCVKNKYPQNVSILTILKNRHPQNLLYKNKKKTKPQFRLSSGTLFTFDVKIRDSNEIYTFSSLLLCFCLRTSVRKNKYPHFLSKYRIRKNKYSSKLVAIRYITFLEKRSIVFCQNNSPHHSLLVTLYSVTLYKVTLYINSICKLYILRNSI